MWIMEDASAELPEPGRTAEPQHALFPADIIDMMARVGRHEFDLLNSQDDSVEIWTVVLEPILGFAHNDPSGFMTALAKQVTPAGGWAAYGASRVMRSLISGADLHGPAYVAIMDGAIAFLRANGVPPMRIGYEWQHWISQGGSSYTWLPSIPAPAESETTITPLTPGELRRVAQLTDGKDSNVILVRQDDAGRYCSVIDAVWSAEDSRRVQSEGTSASTLFELYRDIGLSLQVPPFWYDAELGPFFPLPRAKI